MWMRSGSKPALQRHVQLAAGGDVDREPLLGEEPVGGGAGQRLAGEEDLEVGGALLEGLAVGAGAGAHVVLGVEVGGGAVLFGQLDDVAAGDLEVPVLVDAAPLREDRRARDRIARYRTRLSSLRHRTGILTIRRCSRRNARQSLPKGYLRFEDAFDRLRRFRRRLCRPVDSGPATPLTTSSVTWVTPVSSRAPAGHRLIDLVDGFVDGARDFAGGRGGGRAAACFGRRHRRRRSRRSRRHRWMLVAGAAAGTARARCSNRRRLRRRSRRSFRRRHRLRRRCRRAAAPCRRRPGCRRRCRGTAAFGRSGASGARAARFRRQRDAAVAAATAVPARAGSAFETEASSPPPISPATGRSSKTRAETSRTKATTAAAISPAPDIAPTR